MFSTSLTLLLSLLQPTMGPISAHSFGAVSYSDSHSAGICTTVVNTRCIFDLKEFPELDWPYGLVLFSVGMRSDYLPLLNLIGQTHKGDQITIYTHGNGGDVDGEEAIVDALTESGADVTTIVPREAASASAMIAISGQHMILYPSAKLWFHDVQMAAYEPLRSKRSKEQLRDEDLLWATTTLRNFYKILTPDEIDYIRADKRHFIEWDAKTILQRLTAQGFDVRMITGV